MGVAEQVVALGKKKSFLQEFCASVTSQLLSVCPEDVCQDHVIRSLELDTGWKECTTAKLYVLLHLSTLYSKVAMGNMSVREEALLAVCGIQEKWFRSFLQEHWSTKHVWSQKNFPHMADALLVSQWL